MKFAAFIEYANQDVIAETRPAHRDYLTALREQGQLAMAGPFTDDSGALIVYEAETEEEVRAIIAADPFNSAGVFHSITLKPWNQVF